MRKVRLPRNATNRLEGTRLSLEFRVKSLELSPMIEAYEDIINLPPHVSKKHPQMSMLQRAAQFAPFAALTGHDKAIEETAEQHVADID